MDEKDVMLLAQLLSAMKDLASKLENSYRNRDMEGLEGLKKEIIKLQTQIDTIL